MWLFRLPLVALTLKRRESTAAVKSLVLVLPFEPVIATTGILSCDRHQQASRCRASRVSATSTTAPDAGGPPSQTSTTTAAAPAAKACAAKA